MEGEKQKDIFKDDNISSFIKFDIQKFETFYKILEHPDKFADLFCYVAKTQTKVKDVIIQNIRDIFVNDLHIKKEINNLIKNFEKEEFIVFGRKIGFGIWTLFIIVVTILIEYILKRYMN